MSETFDPRDHRPRGPYGRRTTDVPLRRPTDEDPAGLVDVMLYGRVCSAHHEAERTYFAALDRELELGGRERERAAILSAAANGKAEGLAEAVALLDGTDGTSAASSGPGRRSRRRSRGSPGAQSP